jgi:soluble lytic murein transglycosylase
MANFLAQIIPVQWFRLARILALVSFGGMAASAQSLDVLASNYRKTPTPKTRAALLSFANVHSNDKNGALAFLVLGATEIDQRQFGDALQHLKAAHRHLSKLEDYIAYLSAVAQSELREFPETEHTLSPVWQSTPPSPLAGKSVALEVYSYLETASAKKAIALVEQHRADLSEPQAELLLARSHEADGNGSAATLHYQKIYAEFPLSKEASDAESALAHYTLPPAKSLLTRCLKLIEGGDYSRARRELTSLLPQLSGADLELARVRIGAAQYLAKENKGAHDYLNALHLTTPEFEAERLYHLQESARRLDRIDEMNATLAKLKAYPRSNWRLLALIAAANYYASHNQMESAESLYRTCYGEFPSDPQSAQCHWKIVWAEYLRDPSRSSGLFQEHLKRYPESERASTALYFSGRVAEAKSDGATARAYYDEINNWFPNYYYAMLARERLRMPAVASAAASPDVAKFLAALPLPRRNRTENFVPSSATKERIERAELLASASLDDFADSELRYSAKVDGQPQLMAVELAELASRRDAPDQGIRYIKRFAPGYLSMSIASAPDKFWRLAFPLPYRKALEEYCREHSLDPFVVAALIRQESEFNVKAVSRANARGLTQVMPATGRELGRKLNIPRYQTSMLFTPETNLKIGTYYLKVLLDQLNGKWEETLASYNAGKSRVNSWVAAANYHEPAEFVESIPFTETRLYVQSVMRNAEVYRRLYGQKAR